MSGHCHKCGVYVEEDDSRACSACRPTNHQQGSAMTTCHYKAEARYDPNEDEWIVRLHRWAADMPDHAGTEYLGLCAANAKEEAEFIAASINRSIAFGLGDQLADCAAFFAGGVTDCFSKMEARDGK